MRIIDEALSSQDQERILDIEQEIIELKRQLIDADADQGSQSNKKWKI